MGHGAEKDAGLIEVRADLCHKGNYENIVGQPDMVHMPPPAPAWGGKGTAAGSPLPDLVWFTCASEANGINMFPCTGSRHIDHRTVVACICPCHRLTTVLPPGSTTPPTEETDR